jgi:hypothetical protein
VHLKKEKISSSSCLPIIGGEQQWPYQTPNQGWPAMMPFPGNSPSANGLGGQPTPGKSGLHVLIFHQLILQRILGFGQTASVLNQQQQQPQQTGNRDSQRSTGGGPQGLIKSISFQLCHIFRR